MKGATEKRLASDRPEVFPDHASFPAASSVSNVIPLSDSKARRMTLRRPVQRRVCQVAAEERVSWYCKLADRQPPSSVSAVQKSIGFMMERLDRHLSITELSRLVGLSAPHYSNLFRSTTGYPPIQFFIRMKMRQARFLLERADLTVKHVASMIGYRDALYFSRVFKSVTGFCPTEYRTTVAKGKRREPVRQKIRLNESHPASGGYGFAFYLE